MRHVTACLTVVALAWALPARAEDAPGLAANDGLKLSRSL
jgi:hypothetical protein